jgi:hypothetical protein
MFGNSAPKVSVERHNEGCLSWSLLLLRYLRAMKLASKQQRFLKNRPIIASKLNCFNQAIEK